MTAEKKKELDRKLRTLNRKEGLGIFPGLERKVEKGEKFLIVSYGGTGADVLSSLKDTINRSIDENDIVNHIRLLAIDTDSSTKYKSISVKGSEGQIKADVVERFTAKEFFWLDNGPAKKAVSIGDPGMNPWINPDLPAQIKANGKLLDGSGASSTRQIGRLLLFPQKTINTMEARITDLAKELTDGTTANLNVFIITGISGGTGSGTVIDTTYLIRYFLSKLPGNLGSKTKLFGFVLLPPTGTSDNPIDVDKGNRNGYAALKEIDHYMTIACRGELYSQLFGNTSVESTVNIFDTCYLIDGNIVGMAFSNPREKAKEVVSDCVIDMITSAPLSDGNHEQIPTTESFMSDAQAFSQAMVEMQREQVAPREANYVYCAIGHGKVLVPVELIKSYVSGTAFREMIRLYKACGNITEEDIQDFFDAVLIKDYNEQAQTARIIEETESIFKNVSRSAKKGGPYYTANLIKEATAEATVRYTDLSSKKLVIGKEKKLEQLQIIKKVLLDRLENYFSVYIAILDYLHECFKVEHDLLCDENSFIGYTGTTYTYTPINFTAQDEKSAAIRSWLENQISSKIIDNLSNSLTDSMLKEKAAWTELIIPGNNGKQPAFNGAKLIRDFWSTGIDRIADINIEDLLIKYYSGDAEAKYKEEKTPEGFYVATDETKKYLKLTAEAIVDKMLGTAGLANPLAEIREDILTKENFNGRNIFLISEKAPHLRKYIEEEISTRIASKDKIYVASSSADDRISCYVQYTGIPAYMFSWAKTGEESYEKSIDSIGLHMSETRSGETWRNYPNLIVESIWPKISNPEYTNKREQDINAQVKSVFEKARELGLAELHAQSVTNEFGKYTLFTLPKENRPQTMLFRSYDTEFKGSASKLKAEKALENDTEEKAQELFNLMDWNAQPILSEDSLPEVLREKLGMQFEAKEMHFPGMVSDAYTDKFTKKPKDWEGILTAKLLRTCPNYYNDVRGTVLVMEKLWKKVSKVQRTELRLKNFAQYLAADIFTYSEELYQWTYRDADVEKVLTEIDYGNEEKKTAELFFMFEDYLAVANDVDEAMSEELAYRKNGSDKQETIEKAKVLKAKVDLLIKEIDEKLVPNKENRNNGGVITSQVFRKACQYRGYDVDRIIDFYKKLREALLYAL